MKSIDFQNQPKGDKKPVKMMVPLKAENAWFFLFDYEETKSNPETNLKIAQSPIRIHIFGFGADPFLQFPNPFICPL